MTDSDECFLAVIDAREDCGLLRPCVDQVFAAGFDIVVVACIEGFAGEAKRIEREISSLGKVLVAPLPKTITDALCLSATGSVMNPIVERYRPDWLYFGDTDELIVARDGPFRSLTAEDSVDLFLIARYNYTCQCTETEAEIFYRLNALSDISVITEREDATKAPAGTAGPRWSLHAIQPKTLVRMSVFDRFVVGAHRAEGAEGARMRTAEVSDALIVHVPFTSFSRFEAKVRNARAHLTEAGSTVLKGGRAWHWKWWVQRLEEGGLLEEYEREASSESEYSKMRARGGIRTPREIFELAADPVP